MPKQHSMWSIWSPRQKGVPLMYDVDEIDAEEACSNAQSSSATSPPSTSYEERSKEVDEDTPEISGRRSNGWMVRITEWRGRYRRVSTADATSTGAEDPIKEQKTPEIPKPEKQGVSTAEYSVSFSHFLRIFSYATRGDKLLILTASLASILTGVTLPLMNVVFGQLVGTFSSFYRPNSGETADMFEATMDDNVMYLIYLFAARLFLGYIAVFGFRMASIRISAAMRSAYLEALFKQPIFVLDTLPPGQTAAIITITADVLQIGISEKLSTLLQSVSLVMTALFIAFDRSWLLTLVTGFGLVFIIMCYAITIPLLVERLKEVAHADRISSSIASEIFTSVRMVAACQAEEKMAKRYAAWVRESQRRGLLMSPVVALQQAPVFFAIHATFALSFWFAIYLFREEETASVTTIIIVLMSVMTVVMSIGSIASPVTAAAQAASAASVLFSIIDAPRPQIHGLMAPDVSSQEDIILTNVNFAYPIRHDIKVLNNLNIRFPAGKLSAIVGASGSGKSTIVGLLEQWYRLDGNTTDNALTLFFRNGSIQIDGRNLHEIDLRWWRSQIGLVQQEPCLFNDTIYRNVEFGLVGTEWEHAYSATKHKLIMRACKEAFADEFVRTLPEGYDTQVGEAGMKLSGGQRQRIAIARAIVKQPNILILDEATSAIDVRSERIVQAALDKVSQGRTTIIIAHRLSTIMKADNIVVLKSGQVVQQGTHNDLLNDIEGPYYSLANAQQLSMKEDPIQVTNPLFEKFDYKSKDLERFTEVDLVKAVDDKKQQIYQPQHLIGSFRLFLWEQRTQWVWYTLMLLGCLGAGVAFPLQSYLFAKLISLFDYIGEDLNRLANFWCLMFVILASGVGVAYFVLGWSSNTISFNITAAYRQEYFQNMLYQPIPYYDEEDNSVGSLTARIATDPSQLQQLLGMNSAIVLISVFNIVGSVGISLYFGWKLTLFTVCSSMPVIIAAGFSRMRYETKFVEMNTRVFAESSKFATEAIGAFRTVSAMTLETKIIDRYHTLLRKQTIEAFRTARVSTLVFALSDSISLLCMAFVMWYGARLLASHEYAPFNYLVIYLAIVQGSTSAGQSLSFGPNIAQAFAAANRIRSMRPRIEDALESKDCAMVPSHDDTSSGRIAEKRDQGVEIELKDVYFRYPTRDVPVLSGVNMTIGGGQFAAIVGSSGSGKTSIISLLARFYSARSGKILCAGTDIRSISLGLYRESVSLVAQESSIFEGSIRENVLLGVDESVVTDEQLRQICTDVEIHDFISSLPDGYETQVGSKGISLSGGQRQRLAIARALVRNPSILLLDEATSALDSETEKSVQAVFERTAHGRTMVVVAHRLATIQNADVIFVLNQGQVVESGTHVELLRKRGAYYEMCRSQALHG